MEVDIEVVGECAVDTIAIMRGRTAETMVMHSQCNEAMHRRQWMAMKRGLVATDRF